MHRPSLTDDVRIARVRPLIPPAILLEQVPLAADAEAFVANARTQVARSIAGDDPRPLVVVGPCSVHDTDAAREYADRLARLDEELGERLLLVMRVYFEKPRTTVGWKGLINDPELDGSFRVNDGLLAARRLLVDLAERGVLAGSEFLDAITPQFYADTVTWGAIGARTTESQVHRELASGLSMPVGFKNGTDGSVQIAVDAITAARHPHTFLSVTKQGIAAIVETQGNPHGHVILRGAASGPNYDEASITATCASLESAGLPGRVMVDCSHGNSRKDPARQRDVAASVGAMLERGDARVLGVMIESHLEGGRQELAPRDQLAYGRSITDACLGWDDTAATLRGLAEAVDRR